VGGENWRGSERKSRGTLSLEEKVSCTESRAHREGGGTSPKKGKGRLGEKDAKESNLIRKKNSHVLPREKEGEWVGGYQRFKYKRPEWTSAWTRGETKRRDRHLKKAMVRSV